MAKTLQQKKFEALIEQLPKSIDEFSIDQILQLINGQLEQNQTVQDFKQLSDFFPVKQIKQEKKLNSIEEFIGVVASSSLQSKLNDNRDALTKELMRQEEYFNDKFKQSDLNFLRIRQAEETVKDLKASMSSCMSLIQQKANLLEFRTLQEFVKDDVPKMGAFSMLQFDVSQKAEQNDMRNFKDDFLAHKSIFENLQVEFEKMKSEFSNYTMNSGSELKNIQENFQMNQTNVKDLELQIFRAKENSKEMILQKESQIQELKLQINNLKMIVATKDNITEINEKLQSFVKSKQMEKFREEVIPKIQDFTELIAGYRQDNSLMMNCVQDFDKSLCEKANKSNLFTLYQQVEENFVLIKDNENFKTDMQIQENKRQSLTTKLYSAISQFRNEIQDDIQQIINELIEEKLSQYDKVAKSFQKFMNQEQLQAILDCKVDLELFQQVQDQKANLTDIQKNEKKIEQLYKRLKHICILLSEIAKNSIPVKPSQQFKAPENINTVITRQDFISKQAQILSNWVSQAPLLSSTIDENIYNHKIMGSIQQGEDSIFQSKLSDSPKQLVPIEIFEFENLKHSSQVRNFDSKSFHGQRFSMNFARKSRDGIFRKSLQKNRQSTQINQINQDLESSNNVNRTIETKNSFQKNYTAYGQARQKIQLDNQFRKLQFQPDYIVKNRFEQISRNSMKMSNESDKMREKQDSLQIPIVNGKKLQEIYLKKLNQKQSPPDLQQEQNVNEDELNSNIYEKQKFDTNMFAANKLITSLIKEGGSNSQQQNKMNFFQEKNNIKTSIKIKKFGNVVI